MELLRNTKYYEVVFTFLVQMFSFAAYTIFSCFQNNTDSMNILRLIEKFVRRNIFSFLGKCNILYYFLFHVTAVRLKWQLLVVLPSTNGKRMNLVIVVFCSTPIGFFCKWQKNFKLRSKNSFKAKMALHFRGADGIPSIPSTTGLFMWSHFSVV